MSSDSELNEMMLQIRKYWTTVDGEPELREFAEYVLALLKTERAKAALEAQIQEREYTWQLINDIRYQNVSLDFAKSVSLERLSNAQVDQQLEAEAALKQGPTNAK